MSTNNNNKLNKSNNSNFNNNNNNTNTNTTTNNMNQQPNPFSNIGTPSFNIQQIPPQILQNLTPQQLQLIQQRHQQLLRSRIQQQQHQQQQQKQQQEKQQQPQQSRNGDQNQNNQSGLQLPFNLPPQIAQLPLPMQQQVLASLKQQAIQKNNPSVVAAITMAQEQLQQQIQQLQQQTKGSNQIQNQMGSTGMVEQDILKNSMLSSANKKQANARRKVSGPSKASVGAPSQTFMPHQKMELPPFQTIKYDPPETIIPYQGYWSDQKQTTDTLLYEQIIQRDKSNRMNQLKEQNGYTPFSIFGFSNKEYTGKLWHNLKYYQNIKEIRMESIRGTSQNIPNSSIWGNGYSGYGNGTTNTATKIITGINDDKRPHTPNKMLDVYKQAMSEVSEDLIPIRLEFDYERDKFSLRDTLLWNKNDRLIDVEDFVDDMLADYRFDQEFASQISDVICQSIREQIIDFQPDPYANSKDLRIGGDDMRIKIKFDIVIGQSQLVDQIEWDISNPDNDPEEFAASMCNELQLPGEFQTAIAHSIREQVHVYHKSLVLLGYKFDGSTVEDSDIRSRILPVVTMDNFYRAPADSKLYTPNLLTISAAELERLDKDKDRDSRRKRRQGRFNRRGVVISNNASATISSNAGTPLSISGSSLATNINAGAQTEVLLPDITDVPRTFRTPIPSTLLPGGLDLGPSVESYELKTTTKSVQRPDKPKPKMPPCYVVDHIPGRSLLLSITLPKRSVLQVNKKSNFGSHASVASKSIISNIKKENSQSSMLNQSHEASKTQPPTPLETSGQSRSQNPIKTPSQVPSQSQTPIQTDNNVNQPISGSTRNNDELPASTGNNATNNPSLINQQATGANTTNFNTNKN